MVWNRLTTTTYFRRRHLINLAAVPPPVGGLGRRAGDARRRRRFSPSIPLSRRLFSGAGRIVGMDIISQLQEQVNTIAAITFNTFGSLQRDAPPVRLSSNYPEPVANPSEDPASVAEQPKLMSAALVQAAKQFDALVAALPVSEKDEEAQLKRIAELEAENETIGKELQKQLEAAENELKLVQELFNQAADNCLNLKRPD